MTETAAPAIWTIKALLAWTTKFLAEKGLDSPRLEAELLLAHAMGCKRIDLIVRYGDEPSAAEKAGYRELVARRAEHWPTAYLVGRREFYLLTFEVSPAVLIPRPDTETLVLAATEAVKGQPSPTVLDLGTGSGCVGICIAHQIKTARVTAVDVSPDALSVAKGNAATHGILERMEFLQGDLFAPLTAGAKYDLIVSNPPYITPTELDGLSPEVRDHEPRLALDGGPDGLAFYRRITSEAANWLKPGGTVLVEIGSTQEAAVRALFERESVWELSKTIKDGGGRPRVVGARRVAVL